MASAPSLVDETSSSRSLSGDDADMDSLPSLSYTTSRPSSSAVSRSSSVASSDSPASLQPSIDVNSSMNSRDDDDPPTSLHADHDITEEDDPLSYHSDFDYYTQSFSDPSDSEPDLDPSSPTKQSHPPLDVGITPYSSLYDPVVDFESTSSADTMRWFSVPQRPNNTRTIASPNLEPPRDGNGWRGQPCVPERQRGREDDGRGREASRRNGAYSGGQSSGTFGGGAGGDDNNGDKARRGKTRPPVSSASDYTSSSDDDADGLTVYYSFDGMSNGPPSRSHSRNHSHHSKVGGGSDDDVPLAQRVPTALSAQKSIRKQLDDERQQRRLERVRSSRKTAEPPPSSRPTEPVSVPTAPSRFRKRSVSAAPAPASSLRIAPIEAFPVEDLARKLKNLQTCSHTPPSAAPPTYDTSVPTAASSRVPGYSAGLSRSSSQRKYTDHTTHLQQKIPRVPNTPSQERPLRSMRSFSRPRHSETPRSPVEQTSAPRLGRSATPSRNGRAGRDTPSAGYEQHAKAGRVSDDGRRPSASIPRSSIGRENDVSQRVAQRPPVPPLPISDSTPPLLMAKGPVVQQRIFIGDMQRFNMVEITPATSAGDVINTVAKQGMLDRSGSWMVFEMAQDYGMGMGCSSSLSSLH